MAKLSAREMDAVVETVVKQIEDVNANSTEQLNYQEQYDLSKKLDKECELESKRVVEELLEVYKQKYPEFEFNMNDYRNRIYVELPSKPQNNISKRDIERELLVANISGNIHETMEKIINKYTNK